MLTYVCVCVLQELEYRIDAFRVIHGAHIEHVKKNKKIKKKKTFSVFLWLWTNSIKVGPLVF